MSEYDQKTLYIIASSLIAEGGIRGNPLMDKPQVRALVEELLAKSQPKIAVISTRPT
ncbi:hypothetical protein KBC75_04350 [Candidatus Shapirobacteria bacterium]|nr:hypothetical protein [Candidatus Shapirobacteria bacterium]